MALLLRPRRISKQFLGSSMKLGSLNLQVPFQSMQNLSGNQFVARNLFSMRDNFHAEKKADFRRSFSTEKPANIPPANIAFENLVELQANSCKAYPTNRLFGTRKGNHYEWTTYSEFGKYVEETRKVLKQHDIGFDDKVALICNNRIEWAAILYATQGLGGQVVPMYEAQLEKDWKYIIENSDTKLIVAANMRIYDKVSSYVNTIGNVKSVLCIDAPEDHMHGLQYWLKKVENEPIVPPHPKLHPDHIAVIIYTSGTTGNPKGVELSHKNLCSDVKALRERFHAHAKDQVALTFLPWAHIYGQTNELHTMLCEGATMALVPSRDQLLECLSMVQPTVIASVPILFNKIYDGVNLNLKKQSPIVQSLFKIAFRTARKRNHAKEFGHPVSPLLEFQFQFWNKLLLSKIKNKIGTNIKYLGGGGAATSLPVLQFFEDIGIPIVEGYGLTETSPTVTASSVEWTNRRLGCVGTALLDMEVRIVDPETLQSLPPETDGEIAVTGPNVMVGYRNNAKANAEVFFHADGKRFFRTGDLGRLVEGRFLKITGRIKEQFKLENGKFVVPAPIEDILSRGPFISQCFLYGANRFNTVLLVIPNYVELGNWANQHKKTSILANLPATPLDLNSIGKTAEEKEKLQRLFRDEDFIRMVTTEIIARSKQMKNYERPFKWMPLYHPFTQENQMLTPKMSVRRPNVAKEYDELIAHMYDAHHEGHLIDYPNSPNTPLDQ